MTTLSLLLLPGLLCDHAVWAGQVAQLQDVAQCFMADYDDCDSIEAMARKALDLSPAGPLAVAGHSMGGRVALEIARQAPQRVERIALLDTGTEPIAPGEAGERERMGRYTLLETAQRDGMRDMGMKWAQGMVHPAHLGTAVFEDILSMIERKSPDIFERQIRALLERPDASDTFRALRCPTLLLCGRQDAWSPLARHELMHKVLPTARLAVIEDAGHMAPMEQPGAVAQSMRQWLSLC